MSKRKSLIDKSETLSLSLQCELLNIPHSSFYYEPAAETSINLSIMKLIDEQHTKDPVRFGQLKMKDYIEKKLKIPINRKRIQRLMQVMGVTGEYEKKRTTIPSKNHKIYPYLLDNLAVYYSNQVWSVDITYIPMRKGFMYLVAIIDWFSRYVLSWEISNTIETEFCIIALKRALKKGIPFIFNSDQGSQFTSKKFTSILENNNIQISMDGRGRWLDNVFIERLWRTVKYENIYRNSYETGKELNDGLNEYFKYYNNIRTHQTLKYNTPKDIYLLGLTKSNTLFKLKDTQEE